MARNCSWEGAGQYILPWLLDLKAPDDANRPTATQTAKTDSVAKLKAQWKPLSN
ncbi:hypothetical protein GCM10007159_02640 [Modicisalibacter luteus]|nr:hypothetical protein GCM10007159_02640 [Halomonas lutea]